MCVTMGIPSLLYTTFEYIIGLSRDRYSPEAKTPWARGHARAANSGPSRICSVMFVGRNAADRRCFVITRRAKRARSRIVKAYAKGKISKQRTLFFKINVRIW